MQFISCYGIATSYTNASIYIAASPLTRTIAVQCNRIIDRLPSACCISSINMIRMYKCVVLKYHLVITCVAC